ncbi:S-layer homology domain-containing protein [Bacillus salitolerans]|uniref:S-layer homology domain-containing protein n=1 Tax=Bacillus salitolerans TaxID=1437434 RepID=A0ABW4LNJ2_9BACI
MKKSLMYSIRLVCLIFLTVSVTLVPLQTNAFQKKEFYLALGDSLPAGLNSDGEFGNSYTDFIAESLLENGSLSTYVDDFATSGYTTHQVLDDIVNNVTRNKLPITDQIKQASIITIQAGANDFLNFVDKQTLTVNIDAQTAILTLKQISANISSIVSEIKKLNPDSTIYLIGYYFSFPHGTVEQQNIMKAATVSINTAIETAATLSNVHYVSMYHVFDEDPIKYLPNPLDVHPTVEGYQLMANTFLKEYEENEKIVFTDVPEDHYAKEAIYLLARSELLPGITDNTFGPNLPITRSEAAHVLYNVLNLDQSIPANPYFKDIDESHPAYMAIAKLTEAGIFQKGEFFNPDSPLTRAQMAKILMTAYHFNEQTEVTFTDVDTNHWAYSYITTLASLGITTGYTDGSFKPDMNTTRAQFAAFLYRTYLLSLMKE